MNSADFGVPQFGVNMIPYLSYITGISQAQFAIVTFLAPHDFIVGEIVSFRVSQPFGMVQINNLRGLILAISSLTITVNIDTSNFNAFIYPVSGKVTPPVSVPVGSGIVPGTTTVILNDAFDNGPL